VSSIVVIVKSTCPYEHELYVWQSRRPQTLNEENTLASTGQAATEKVMMLVCGYMYQIRINS
jgi:hypothetical protein